MAGLQYVGMVSEPDDLMSRQATVAQVDATSPNRTDAASQIIDVAANKASKAFVDNADNAFQLVTYANTRDALNIPLSAKGAPNGVASLDGSTKVPLIQVPSGGAGYIQGPYGPRHQDGSLAVFTGSTGSTPLRICDWDIGPVPASIRPVVFLSSFVSAINGKPVIEVRASDGQNTYANQVLVGRSFGRTKYNTPQVVTVLPTPTANGQSGLTTPPSYTNLWLTAWVYDQDAQVVSVQSSDWLVTASVWLWRTAE